MVDIHSHVLYGMDDGPREFETSLAMLRLAFDNGTTDLVATPHADLRFTLQPQEISNQLQRLSTEAGIPRLHRGCDFHLSFDNIEAYFVAPTHYTVNGLCYLLVEFSDSAIPISFDRVFGRMIDGGITPILTHPERNPILSKKPSQVADFVRCGCLVQVTAQSLTGRFGKNAESAARHLLTNSLVHFIASDAHDLEHRPPKLRPAFELIEREYGPEIAQALFVNNPMAVIAGAALPPQPENVTKPRRWFKL